MKTIISKNFLAELNDLKSYKQQSLELNFGNIKELVELTFLYAQRRRIRLYNVPSISNSIKKHIFTPGQFTKIVDGSCSYSQRSFGTRYLENYWHFFKSSRLSLFFSLSKASTFLLKNIFRTKSLPLYDIKLFNFSRNRIYILSKRSFLKQVSARNFKTLDQLVALPVQIMKLQILFLQFLQFRLTLKLFRFLNKSRCLL